MQNKGTFYLIPTPLADQALDQTIVPQLQQIIKGLDYFLVEDIRTARRFISSLKLGIEIESLTFHVLNKKTSEGDVIKLLEPLKRGVSVGMMSEAGCPGIADPGAKAVEKAHLLGFKVHPITGPSSIFLALMASGFSGQQFCFHGYLPIKPAELIQKIKILEDESIKKRQTQIFIETPFRNNKLLDILLNTCRNDTKLCIGKNLTGEDEEIITRTIKDWRKHSVNLHKIPTIFLMMG